MKLKIGLLLFVFLVSFLVRWGFQYWGYELFSFPDNVYHTIRFEQVLDQFPECPTFDTMSHFPEGNRVHWPSGLPLAMAIGPKVLGYTSQDANVFSFLSLLGPVLGAILATIVLYSMMQMVSSKLAIGVGICLVVLSPELLTTSHYGCIDHHLWIQLGVSLLFIGFYRENAWAIMFGSLAAFLFSPESLLYVTLLFPVIILSRPYTHFTRIVRLAILFFPFLSALLSLGITYLFDTAPPSLTNLEIFGGGLFPALWFFSLGLFGCVWDRFLPDKKAEDLLDWKTLAKVSTMTVGLISIWLVYFYFSNQIQIFSRLGKMNRLTVAEELSPLITPSLWTSPLWYKFHPIIFLGLAFVIFKSKKYRELSMVLALMILVGLMEYRHLRAFAIFPVFGVVLTLDQIGSCIKGRPLIKYCLSFYIAFLFGSLAGHFLEYYPEESSFRRELRKAVASGAQWIREDQKETPWELQEDPGIVSGWSLGHHIRSTAKQPVVLDPLNFPNRIMEPIERLFGALSAEDLITEMKTRRSRFLILPPPQNSILDLPAKNLEGAFHHSNSGIVYDAPILDLAMFRLLHFSVFNAEFIAHFQLRHISKKDFPYLFLEDGQDNRQLIRYRAPLVQVFELKPGAIIHSQVPEPTPVVEIHLQFQRNSDEATRRFTISKVVGSDGLVKFGTAQPAPVETLSFSLPSAYRFETKHYYATLSVSQAEVDAGATLDLNWHPKSGPNP